MAIRLNIDDILIFNATFEYQGPRYTEARRECCIGHWVFGFFDAISDLTDDKGLIIPETAVWTEYPIDPVPIVITDSLSEGNYYPIRVRIYEDGIFPTVYLEKIIDDAIFILEGIPPEKPLFRNLSVTISKG